MTPHFLKWSFGPKIESVDGICQQTDSRNRFYLDVKTGPEWSAGRRECSRKLVYPMSWPEGEEVVPSPSLWRR